MNHLPKIALEKLTELRQRFTDMPVPVIAIANDFGIKIYETNDFAPDQSGSIKKEDNEYVIYLKASDPSPRKRFTVAHELGHFIMHKAYLANGEESITPTLQPLLNRSQNGAVLPEEKEREFQANQFAAELLMPENEFKKVFETATRIEEVADYFHVSSSAVAIRAKDLLGVFLT